MQLLPRSKRPSSGTKQVRNFKTKETKRPKVTKEEKDRKWRMRNLVVIREGCGFLTLIQLTEKSEQMISSKIALQKEQCSDRIFLAVA
jgi:hypothetical protein